MSYYINGPRIFTPSTFKQSKQFLPMESFGSTVEQAKEAPPTPLNVCHMSRFSNLQHTHPSAFRHRKSLATCAVAHGHRPRPILTRALLLASLTGTYAMLRKAEAEKAAEMAASKSS